jgi:hypothetical protein
MKRFIQTDFFLALKESKNATPAEGERMYDKFRDDIMGNALTLDRMTYCCALNLTLAELASVKSDPAVMEKNLLS